MGWLRSSNIWPSHNSDNPKALGRAFYWADTTHRIFNIWRSHVTRMNAPWLIQHINEWCHMYECTMTHTTYEWFMSHVWMHHDSYNIWMRHVTCMNAPWLIQHINASCHMYECTMTHTTPKPFNEPVTLRMHTENTTYEWVMSHIWLRRDSPHNPKAYTFKKYIYQYVKQSAIKLNVIRRNTIWYS